MRAFAYPDRLDDALETSVTLVLAAPASAWAAAWHEDLVSEELTARIAPLLEELEAGTLGRTEVSVGPHTPRRLVVAVLPDDLSRWNSPSRRMALTHCLDGMDLGKGDATVAVYMDDDDHLPALACGIARTQPLFTRKSGPTAEEEPTLNLCFFGSEGAMEVDAHTRTLVEAQRFAASLVDHPAAELGPDEFTDAALDATAEIEGVSYEILEGDALEEHGMGGILGVGQGAVAPPRLVILRYSPKNPDLTVALVGKGIVFDTGGLHLKPRGGMEGMKGDMGGAAAVLGAFQVLATEGCPHEVYALLALAENAIGPDSYRPDDILELHSGHTVEINNTDAEGRLVLADAVSYAARDLEADVVIDAATLTGAQLVSTGLNHAAIVSNRHDLEEHALYCGLDSGDLTAPLPFIPEVHEAEFKSPVADMRNSVKNRMNAQSSCAAWFIYAQIDDLDTPWLHVDLAGPAWHKDRGTGFGVALLATLVERLQEEHLDE